MRTLRQIRFSVGKNSIDVVTDMTQHQARRVADCAKQHGEFWIGSTYSGGPWAARSITYYRRFAYVLVWAAIATVSLSPVASALCVSTTENLLRVEIYSCQPVEIRASISKSDTHAIHKRGARIKGTLITGKVVTSDPVWMADSLDKSYIMEAPIVPEGTVATFFHSGSPKDNCDDSVGSVLVFVTDRPCCDVIPASGICLVPDPLLIIREEHMPDRWSKWPTEAARP